MSEKHVITPRKVVFDLSHSPLHWLPGDSFSSHIINSIHLLLPAGELWFCRVYNKALPLVTDNELRIDVRAFIEQEAIHARAHKHGEDWLKDEGIDVSEYRKRVDWLFKQLLGDNPLGYKIPQRLEKRWLVLRVGLIAAIEHFTGMLGDWCMNSDSWDKGDPVVADLFRWHLAEEVEHRTVAFDLFAHLCRTQLGFYISRQALMALVFPLFIYAVVEGYRSIAEQDQDKPTRKWSKAFLPLLLWRMEKVGRSSGNMPAFSYLCRRTLLWLKPGFHPSTEGDTEQALAYLAQSPAALAGQAA